MPAVKQNRSKLADTSSQALPTAPAFIGGKAVSVVLTLFMALLSFVESAPRAYWLKASNAAPSFSTFPGTIPSNTVVDVSAVQKQVHSVMDYCLSHSDALVMDAVKKVIEAAK